ncbi:MAG: DUF899 domain-containing protein, partial [Mesorhizobium sp.]
MHRNKVVSREDWFEAHKAHLNREKELTRLRERVAAERRQLPWLKVRKDYVFETEHGPKKLADLFAGRSQLIVYHFVFAPGSTHHCESCAFVADHIDGANQHLRHHDVSLVVIARAPLAELLPYKQRMGWKFDWVSSTDRQIASGEAVYNFETPVSTSKDLPGTTVFYREEAGDIFLTFMSRARGSEQFIGAYQYLDMAPKGRGETGPYGTSMDWVRLHDDYGNRSRQDDAC